MNMAIFVCIMEVDDFQILLKNHILHFLMILILQLIFLDINLLRKLDNVNVIKDL